ncbi:Putative glucoamylase [Singulisphaera sp. GP187]|uniref:glucoamylase family protein n=1 Tax=Singulisphaera sp. GP187 TaxID=1882752 RepID=UPI0009259FE1|nr:glucoamylase family protein [Singulisphaera sp. GP187]SIN72963.1 Putative glucoamylase [Singulisphaera sp. GP187]
MTPRKVAATVALTLLSPAVSTAQPSGLGPEDRAQLATYARDTWRSIETITSGVDLPADALRREGDVWIPTGLTSPSNIAAYLWSTLAAENLGLITRDESTRRLSRTLEAVARLERSNGFYYNWYDPTSGAKSRTWPGGGLVRPFLSSVDNGWLAAALMVLNNARPELRPVVAPLLDPMNFAFFYNPYDANDPVAHPGQLRGGYWPDERVFTEFHYGTLNTEPRIASYVGIARGQLPGAHYYHMHRAGGSPGAPTRSYAGVSVVEGSQEVRGMRLVPTWDGTMFEALMVTLFVPEAEWAPESWGVNHPLYVKAQIDFGLNDPRLGFWGVSASCDPEGGYYAFGVPGVGAWSSLNPPAHGREGVVTPHASLLALRYAPAETMANLRAMAARFPVYGPHGFADSVDVITGRVSDRVLILDQGMILAAIANALHDDVLVRAFSDGAVEATVRPLIAPERFEAGLTSHTSSRTPRAVPVSLATASVLAAETEWLSDSPTVPPIPAPHLSPSRQAVKAPFALGDTLQATTEGRPNPPPKRRSRKGRRNKDGEFADQERLVQAPPDERDFLQTG